MAGVRERVMPLLVFNMGGEMLYILEQRLKAQEVAIDKSRKGELLNNIFLFLLLLYQIQSNTCRNLSVDEES